MFEMVGMTIITIAENGEMSLLQNPSEPLRPNDFQEKPHAKTETCVTNMGTVDWRERDARDEKGDPVTGGGWARRRRISVLAGVLMDLVVLNIALLYRVVPAARRSRTQCVLFVGVGPWP